MWFLGENSPYLQQEAVDHDIAYTTLRRAFHRLACVTEKTWWTGNWRWIWRMPGNPERRATYHDPETFQFEGSQEEEIRGN